MVLDIPARITNKTLRRLNFGNAQMTKFANVLSVTFELVFNSKCPFSDSDCGSPKYLQSLTEGTACKGCSNSHPHQILSWVYGNLLVSSKNFLGLWPSNLGYIFTISGLWGILANFRTRLNSNYIIGR